MCELIHEHAWLCMDIVLVTPAQCDMRKCEVNMHDLHADLCASSQGVYESVLVCTPVCVRVCGSDSVAFVSKAVGSVTADATTLLLG